MRSSFHTAIIAKVRVRCMLAMSRRFNRSISSTVKQPLSPSARPHRQSADEDRAEDADGDTDCCLALHQSLQLGGVDHVLSVSSSPSSLSLSLLCPSSARSYSNAFTPDYIVAVTAKTRAPLSYAAFLSLLTAALSPASSRIAACSLDLLSPAEIRSLRFPHTALSASAPPAPADDRKRYLILSQPFPSHLKPVHYPLPLLLNSGLQAGGDEEEAAEDAEDATDAGPRAGGRSGLSVLTETIGQLSRALKEARREVRAEREKRKAREAEDRKEREELRKEVEAVKARLEQRVRAGREEERKEREDGDEQLEQLRRRCRDSEDEARRWRSRCAQLEREVREMRAGRQVTGRGRERERVAGSFTAARVASSRSASPSYLRPTSSTQAKQSRSSSPATSPRLPVAVRRPASPRVPSPRPAPLHRHVAPSSSSSASSSSSPVSSPTARKRFDPSDWLRDRRLREEEVRTSRRERKTEEASPRAAGRPTLSAGPQMLQRREPSPQREAAGSRETTARVEREEEKEVTKAAVLLQPRPVSADVQSRLSALQSFLRAEKERSRATAGRARDSGG